MATGRSPKPKLQVRFLVLLLVIDVIQRRGGIGNRTGPLNQGATLVSYGFESHRLCQVMVELRRVSLIGKAAVSKTAVGIIPLRVRVPHPPYFNWAGR